MAKKTKIEKHKTWCCKSSWYVKARADFRCSKCEKDVTLEVLLLAQTLDKENK